MRFRFAFISITVYLIHSYLSLIFFNSDGSLLANGFPRFSLGVQQVINDRTGRTVGNLHERRVGVTYQTNIGEQTRECYAREVIPLEEPEEGSAQQQALWILLHGALHDSSIWIKNGVAELLAEQGFRSLSVDMPGFGEVSDQKRVPANQMSAYMEAMRIEFESDFVVVIAPVMAGKFALPWLMNVPTSFLGFIAIDTIETERYPDEQYESITNLPILLVYGERDQVGQTAVKKFSLVELYQVEVVPSFGTNWYQEKTKTLKDHVSNFAATVIEHVNEMRSRDLPEGERGMGQQLDENGNPIGGEAGIGGEMPMYGNVPGGESYSVGQVQPPMPSE